MKPQNHRTKYTKKTSLFRSWVLAIGSTVYTWFLSQENQS